jgi:hypothetical protein
MISEVITRAAAEWPRFAYVAGEEVTAFASQALCMAAVQRPIFYLLAKECGAPIIRPVDVLWPVAKRALDKSVFDEMDPSEEGNLLEWVQDNASRFAELKRLVDEQR